MLVTAVRMDDAHVAFRLLSEIRRFADTSLWGDVSAVALGAGVLLLIPAALWRSPAIRELAWAYGGSVVASDVDAGDVAIASTGVSLDLHPDDPRLSGLVSGLLGQAATSWTHVLRSGGAAARSAELLHRIENRVRRRYPRIRIVEERRGGDEVIWHVYRDDRVA